MNSLLILLQLINRCDASKSFHSKAKLHLNLSFASYSEQVVEKQTLTNKAIKRIISNRFLALIIFSCKRSGASSFHDKT